MDRDDGEPRIVNAVIGGSEQVVQARDITGGVHVHGSDQPQFPRPRQLPRRITHFTGRDAELAKLDELLGDDGARHSSTVISAIAGAAGIGKPHPGN